MLSKVFSHMSAIIKIASLMRKPSSEIFLIQIFSFLLHFYIDFSAQWVYDNHC